MEAQKQNRAIIAGGAVIAFLAILIKGIPVFNGIRIAFKDYKLPAGISGSPWIGFANFSKTLSSFAFWRVLSNTVKLNLLYLFVVMVFALFLAISLMHLSKRLQNIFMVILLIPLFIPGSTLVHICFTWFKGTVILANATIFPFLYALLLAIQNLGIPTFFILKTWQMQKGMIKQNGFERLRAPLVFVLVQLTFILSSNSDILGNMLNPLVYKTGDTLDQYIFRNGFMQMKVGTAISVWLIQLAVQLVIGLTVYFILGRIIKKTPYTTMPQADLDRTAETNPAGFILPVLYSTLIVWFVFKPLLVDGIIGLTGNGTMIINRIAAPYFRYIIIYGSAAFIGVPIMVLMAKCMQIRGGMGGFFRVFLVIMFISGGLGLHHYLFFKTLGLANTVFSMMLYYLFPVAGSLALGVIIAYRQKEMEQDGTSDMEAVWKPAFVLGLMNFIAMWNAEQVPLALIARQEAMPPALLSRMASQAMGPGDAMNIGLVLGMDLLICILPVALFLIFRREITQWVLLAYTRLGNGHP